MDFGKKLKELRERQNLTMNELARRSGVSQSAISYIEAGRTPSIEHLSALCKTLGLTLKDFFSDEAPDIPPNMRRLLETANQLTPRQLELLHEVMEEWADYNRLKYKKKHTLKDEKINLSKIPMAAHIEGDEKVQLTPELEDTIIDAIRESRQRKQEREKGKPDKI